MLGQLRQRLGGKMRRDNVILQLRAKLVPDLLVDSAVTFWLVNTTSAYRGLPGCKRIEFCGPEAYLSAKVFSVIGYRDVQSIFRASTADRFRFKLRITFKL